MSATVSHCCDHCGKPIGAPYGPLCVTISSATEPQVDAAGDFCTFGCALAWMARRGGFDTAQNPAQRQRSDGAELLKGYYHPGAYRHRPR